MSYSFARPDILRCVFWLLSRLNMPFTEHQFHDKDTVEIITTSAPKAIPKTKFQDSFRKWKHQWDKVVQSKRKYFKDSTRIPLFQIEYFCDRVLSTLQAERQPLYLSARSALLWHIGPGCMI